MCFTQVTYQSLDFLICKMEIIVSNLRSVRIQINSKCKALNVILGTEYLVKVKYDTMMIIVP